VLLKNDLDVRKINFWTTKCDQTTLLDVGRRGGKTKMRKRERERERERVREREREREYKY
jgi:hypothetical protein